MRYPTGKTDEFYPARGRRVNVVRREMKVGASLETAPRGIKALATDGSTTTTGWICAIHRVWDHMWSRQDTGVFPSRKIHGDFA